MYEFVVLPSYSVQELDHKSVKAGSNLLLHSRVESYPYIGVTWSVQNIILTSVEMMMIIQARVWFQAAAELFNTQAG